MGWLEQHHTGVVRTATGVVLCAGAVTGVVANMAFSNLAADNAQKQHQIDALAHQLQQQGASPSVPAEAGPTPGAIAKESPTASPTARPSGTPTVILLAGGGSGSVVAIPGGSSGSQGSGGTSGGSGGTGGAQGGSGDSIGGTRSSGTPTPSPSPSQTHTPSPSPSPTGSQQPLLPALVGTVSGTLKTITGAVVPTGHGNGPKQKPSPALAVLYLVPATRRHP